MSQDSDLEYQQFLDAMRPYNRYQLAINQNCEVVKPGASKIENIVEAAISGLFLLLLVVCIVKK